MRKTRRNPPLKSSHSVAEDGMMGVGHFASSSSSSFSTSSSLSPLAPPFTVERSNPNKHNLNPNLDSRFNGSSVNSPWPYSQSSIATQGLLADSIRTATVPSANNYLISDSVNPPSTHDWSSMNSSIKSGLEPVNSHGAHLSTVNPNPQHDDSFSYNHNEAVPFYYSYALLSSDDDDDDDAPPMAPLNEDGYNMFRCTDFVHGYGSSPSDGSQWKNSDLTAHTSTPFMKFPEPHPLVSEPFLEPSKEPWNTHRSYTSYAFDYGNNHKFPAVKKSSRSVVIKPPAAASSIFSAQDAVATKSAEISSPATFKGNEVLVSRNPLKQKESQHRLDSKSKESGLDLNQLSFQMGRTDDHSNISTDSQLNFEFKASPSIKVPDVHITKEHIDQHDPAEDSPCWKGAPTHFSPFGLLEPESSQLPMKKLNLQGSQTDHILSFSSNVPSLEPHGDNVSDDKAFASTPTEKDQKSGGPEVVGLDSFNDVAKPRKGYDFLVEPSRDVLVSETRIQSTDADMDQSTTEILDVNVLVKALSNLSDLLLLHCSKDERGLKEQDHKAVNRVICNLNACISRKIQQDTFLQDTSTTPMEDDLPKVHNMVQTIKKVLGENLECEEDLSSDALLHKNLWLEAEAELCAVRYTARFQRAKRQMEKLKASDVESSFVAPNPVKMAEKERRDDEASSNGIQSSEVAEGPLLQEHVGKDDDAVVKHADGNQKRSLGTENVEHSVMARLHVLKCREAVVASSSGGGTSPMQNQFESGLYTTSDWEHVLKDELS